MLPVLSVVAPTAQEVQDEAPAAEYDPAAHVVQTVDPAAAAVPAGQAVQVADTAEVCPAGPKKPAEQTVPMHVAWPEDEENVPGAQRTHAVAGEAPAQPHVPSAAEREKFEAGPAAPTAHT